MMNEIKNRINYFANFSTKKSKDPDGKVTIDLNFLFLTLLVPTCFVLFRDYFMFTFQLLNPNIPINKVILVGNIAILIVTFITLLYIFYSRYFLKGIFSASVYFPIIKKIDLFIVLYLCLLTLTRIAIPDSSVDTVNYHLLLQKPSFINNVTYNFFPGEFGTYFYPLSDRLFYLFRFVLGYRAGTILNTIAIIIVYFQIKDYFSSNNIITNKYALAISSLFIISTEFILAEIGIYKVDFLFVPFLFEIFRITFTKKHYASGVLVYAIFLTSIAFSLKFISIFFSAPILIFLLFKYRKFLNNKNMAFACLAGLIPIMVYMAYNVIQTQNPFFPFFDSIFNSPFYSGDLVSQVAAGEKGPKSAIEIALWPFFMFLFPSKTAQPSIAYYSGRITLGSIVLIAYLVTALVNKNMREIMMGILCIITSLLWTISSGFIRYGLFQEILVGLVVIEYVSYLMKNKKYYLKLCCLFIVIMTAQTIFAQYLFVSNHVDWSLRRPFYTDINWYFNNIKMIGLDYNPLLGQMSTSAEVQEHIDEADVWFILPADHNSEYVNLLNDNIPMINMNFSRFSEKNKIIYNSILNNKDFVDKYLVSRRNLQQVSSDLSTFNFYILEHDVFYPTFIPMDSGMHLVKISNSPPLIKRGVTDNLDVPVFNNNFYLPDINKQGDSYIWSGPDPESEMVFSYPGTKGDAIISFCILKSYKPEEIKSLQLLVNGSRVNLSLTKNRECPFLFSGKILGKIFEVNPGTLELVFKIPTTVSPIDLEMGKDSRKLGFALTWLRIE